ncbi:albusnodin family lasso peptide [Streptomyces sp. NPDC004042]
MAQEPTTDDETEPPVIDLGDAAVLTRGSNASSVEGKQTPYN